MLSSNPRVLYVDDDADSCEIISLMLHLENNNYRVSTASITREVLDLMESDSIDLYILDYALMDLTGVELCERIRQISPTTPILFYSAMAREIDRAKAMAAGANEYLVKPNDLDKLMDTVQRLLIENSAVSKTANLPATKVSDRIY